ncbi:MAG: hypothetical protein J5449_05945, partial [Oscillospiraceae bacterium]|nr:hypothetical protein [Oscillospiraceae bacterium]
MKRPFSPLVWLCVLGAAALSAWAILDPNGVYAGYTAALDRGTPPIAAVFTAAQDGVYPWSVFDSPEDIPYSPAYRPLTGTVTDDEMRSSVGNDEPFSDPAAGGDTQPVPETDGSDGSSSDAAGDAEEVVEENGGFVTVDLSWFDDALFIGDSHTEGFCDYAGVKNATYYYKRGVDIWSVMTKAFVNGKQTIPQALSQRQFGKIYIMLGINEIGCGTTESFAEQYGKVVAQLHELQPNAYIYIQAIFHTSQKKSASTIYNNERINARNEAISKLADGKQIFFLDCNEVFDDETGALTSTYSGDGVHVKAPYYTMWRDYLLRFGRADAPNAVVVPTPSEPVDGPELPVGVADERIAPAPASRSEAVEDDGASSSSETGKTVSEPTEAADPTPAAEEAPVAAAPSADEPASDSSA